MDKEREALIAALRIFDWLAVRSIYQDAGVKEAHRLVLDALYATPEQAQREAQAVAWVNKDEAENLLWSAIHRREYGNPTDDKLILEALREKGVWLAYIATPPQAQPEFTERDLMDVEEPIALLAKDHAQRGYSGYYVTLNDDDRLQLCKAWPKLQAYLRASLSQKEGT